MPKRHTTEDDNAPTEQRNRVYEFIVEAEGSRGVLPCLALTQVCRQVRSEYRPICMKHDGIIKWKKIPGYIRTFYPISADGKVENIELAPSSLTIRFFDPFTDTAYLEIDFLLIKMAISKPSFASKLLLAYSFY
ncbi:hypothetical protein Ptr86124_001570 [Pyrenophora tritici-repentis]|uniref:Uncharacterized protein n=2 Tax=Pyrenophora tritici-repentis TaxID=45151 RepID=A0A922T3A9_9PLEO|nr:hypothetical protein Ptr86124_001570 [Pyrenophora tritici-repentis]